MSRTDAHRPGWVQQFDPDVPAFIRHDHTSGRCVEETLEYARDVAGGTRRRYRHTWYKGRCSKYEWLVDPCPHHDYLSRKRPWESPCEVVRDRYASFLRWRVLVSEHFVWPEHEHTRRVYHEDWPCTCDDDGEDPTCSMYFDRKYWIYSHSVYGKGVPKWFLDHVYHNPMRREARDVLREAMKEWNATGDTDLEPEPRQARHGGSWYYW